MIEVRVYLKHGEINALGLGVEWEIANRLSTKERVLTNEDIELEYWVGSPNDRTSFSVKMEVNVPTDISGHRRLNMLGDELVRGVTRFMPLDVPFFLRLTVGSATYEEKGSYSPEVRLQKCASYPAKKYCPSFRVIGKDGSGSRWIGYSEAQKPEFQLPQVQSCRGVLCPECRGTIDKIING